VHGVLPPLTTAAHDFRIIARRPAVGTRDNDSMRHEISAVDVWQANCGHYYNAQSGRMITLRPHTIVEFAARNVRPDAAVYEAHRA